MKLPRLPSAAAVVVTADHKFSLFVNGQEAGSGDEWEKPRLIDIRSRLVVGRNVFALRAEGAGSGEKQPRPAGLYLLARLRAAAGGAGQRGPKRWDFGSDADWLCSTQKQEGWEKVSFVPRGWRHATELGEAGMVPWRLEDPLTAAWSGATQYGRVRAALTDNDPLMSAMGRPNREQVVTRRASVATTLEALELTNGATLAGLLKDGSARLLAAHPASGPALVQQLYASALGRPPSPAEQRLAGTLVGNPPQQAGVEDLLWSMTMLPEFQLIY